MRIRRQILIVLITLFILSTAAYFIYKNKVQVFSSFSTQPITKVAGNNIIIYGDTRTGHDIHKKIASKILSYAPIAVFHTGDLVEDGNNPADWVIFNKITEKLFKSTRYYPTLGNHEYNADLYYKNFALPNNERWYSVNIRNIHFIVLDSNTDISKNSPQYTWFINDLKNISKNIEYTICIFHHPIFTATYHFIDDSTFKSNILPILIKYNIKAVFSGHSHSYERFEYKNIAFITTGGGGAPVYDKMKDDPNLKVFAKENHFCVLLVGKNNLLVKVINLDNKLIDTFKISK